MQFSLLARKMHHIMTDADLQETVSLNGQTKVKPGFYIVDFKKLPGTLPGDGKTTYKIQVEYSKHI